MCASEQKRVKDQGGCPRGFTGVVTGRLMNTFHRPAYRAGLAALPAVPHPVCLDIGCGGGKAVQMLARQFRDAKVFGLDHSEEMIRLASRVNRFLIQKGRVEIVRGSVSALPFPDASFHIITAFETIQFWPEMDHSLAEVRRKLNASGTLLIVNRLPREGTRWHAFAQIKDPEDYRSRFRHAGFSEMNVDTGMVKGWIVLTAR